MEKKEKIFLINCTTPLLVYLETAMGSLILAEVLEVLFVPVQQL